MRQHLRHIQPAAFGYALDHHVAERRAGVVEATGVEVARAHGATRIVTEDADAEKTAGSSASGRPSRVVGVVVVSVFNAMVVAVVARRPGMIRVRMVVRRVRTGRRGHSTTGLAWMATARLGVPDSEPLVAAGQPYLPPQRHGSPEILPPGAHPGHEACSLILSVSCQEDPRAGPSCRLCHRGEFSNQFAKAGVAEGHVVPNRRPAARSERPAVAKTGVQRSETASPSANPPQAPRTRRLRPRSHKPRRPDGVRVPAPT